MNKNPWCETGESENSISNQVSFEDNFAPTQTEKLPDSKEYLETLEKKLNKLKSNSCVLKQLADRRETCLENLLRGTIQLENFLPESFDDSSRTSQLVRHVIPEQAINSVELLHIIKHDHLEADSTENIEPSEHTTVDN